MARTFSPPLLGCMYMCLCVFERERERERGTEKWAEVCGKPWCRLVFVWLGLRSRGPRSSGAPPTHHHHHPATPRRCSELLLANILSSDSGDGLNREKTRPRGFAAKKKKSEKSCTGARVRGCLGQIESAAVTRAVCLTSG